jgi:penicillin-binding protein 2
VYLLQPPEDVPSRLSSRVTVRIAVLTGLLVAALLMILLRLWSLQVLSGEHYRALANDNQVRELRVQAPRGEILDRRGRVLVENRPVIRLELRPADLPSSRAERRRELSLVERVAGLSPAQLRQKIREAPDFAGHPIVLRQGLGRERLFYLLENRDRLPGVSVARTYVRTYKEGSLAAHLLGLVGQIGPAQLKEPQYGGLEPGDIIGQAGVEYSYDRHLRGTAGEERIQVDALGRPKGVLASEAGRPGDNLRLTLDSDLQATGEAALRSRGLPGAFVAMNVHTGAVLAMGSFPTYDPAFYTKPHTRAQYRSLENRADAPLIDRADQGGYPTGSAFKPITATAALEEGLIDPNTIFNDTGSLDIGGAVLHNAGGAANGPVDMSDALKVSSDVYFYSLGLEARAEGDHGQIQDWARRFGLGEKPGIDLPNQGPGLIPTPAWRDRLFHKGTNPYIDRTWTQGDNVNLAIGQGDVQVTPLQLARAYAALANGGTLVTPHLGKRIEGLDGGTVERIRPPPRRRLHISELTRETVLGGMERSAMEPGGTSYSVFGGFPFAIAGKTGTAERGEGVADQSWYGAVAPFRDPRIAVVATVERGGFGVESAAPVVARILEQYFGLGESAGGSSSGLGGASNPE